MPDDLESLRAVAAREAARIPLYTYVDRIDAADVDAVGGLFVPDGVFDLLGTECHGREEIVRTLRGAVAAFDRTSHHVSNPLITIADGEARLSASLYAYHVMKETGTPWQFWGRYYQRLAPAGDGWSIVHMTLVGIASDPPMSGRQFTGHPDRRVS